MSMKPAILPPALALVAVAACGGIPAAETPVSRGAATAETACVQAVDRNMGRGGAVVDGAAPAAAGTLVNLTAADGSDWRCLASGGVVADLGMRR